MYLLFYNIVDALGGTIDQYRAKGMRFSTIDKDNDRSERNLFDKAKLTAHCILMFSSFTGTISNLDIGHYCPIVFFINDATQISIYKQ